MRTDTASNGNGEEHEMEDVQEDPEVEALDLDTLFEGADSDADVPPEDEGWCYLLSDQAIAEVALQAGFGPMGQSDEADQVIRDAVVWRLCQDRRLMEEWAVRIPTSQIPPGARIYMEAPTTAPRHPGGCIVRQPEVRPQPQQGTSVPDHRSHAEENKSDDNYQSQRALRCSDDGSVYVDPTGLGLEDYYQRGRRPPWKDNDVLVFTHQNINDLAQKAGYGRMGREDPDTDQVSREAVLRYLFMDRVLMANRPGVIPRSRVPAGVHIYTEPPP